MVKSVELLAWVTAVPCATAFLSKTSGELSVTAADGIENAESAWAASTVPVGPVAPVAPVTPVAPVGPVGPVAPVTPVGQVQYGNYFVVCLRYSASVWLDISL